MPLTIPNVIPAPPTLSSAATVNANFTAIKSFIDTNVQKPDAISAYTGQPDLVSYIEPTNAVHFAPKRYVDKRGTAFIKAVKGLVGTTTQDTAIQSSLSHNVPAGVSTHLLEFSGSLNPVTAGGGQGYAIISFGGSNVYFHVFDMAPDLHTAFHGSTLLTLNLSVLTSYTIIVQVGVYSGAIPANNYQLQDGSIVWTAANDDLTVLT